MTLNSDRRRLFGAPAGTLELVPANAELFAEWRQPKENLLLALAPERFQQLAIAEYDDDRIDFALPRSGQVDGDAHRIAKLIEAEFRHTRNGSVNEIYLDSLLTVFATHLLRRYAGARSRFRGAKQGGMSVHTLKRVDDFIRANISRKISVADLAAVACLSPSHFNRAFRETTGQAPYHYITTLRLRLVEDLAKQQLLTFGEIAPIAGFATQSQMTAMMQRYWGLTPSDIRRNRKS
ncbi:helix-turn-helix domain-containing protein [Agrobacterium sp. LMR679]|uniref:helix-turn-helix domain-containing protein n=1 Tax=Agrobacterium sp. LMR679 TaxID=3014335 RepID=UPI0022AF5BE2|nr:AraC family transcriptional regulator [Agrobacterium sp. LMR679]MCZ4072114.1 AraC family transcriptional regulator [Agrobacterium sp. LMR679]